MSIFSYKGRHYEVDDSNFLQSIQSWDKNFAEGMALQLGITDGLTKSHWNVINFIRNHYREIGICPMVYQTCTENELYLQELKKLFPTGYVRGACKIAGINYKEAYLGAKHLSLSLSAVDKTYLIDVRGFLVDPEAWDENYALHRAFDMNITEGKLTEKHWQIIRFLRKKYKENKTIPTVYETCEANNLELDELERLFPDGYHRGAVKISGLRER